VENPGKQEQRERVKGIFGEAIEREPGARSAFLDEACGADTALRSEVESLLAEFDRSVGLSQQPFFTSGFEATAPSGTIGPYQLIKKLGEGGMGQVWLAEQKAPVARQVALKLIRPGFYDASVVQRFQAERQSLAIMDHPTIAKVFDAGTTAAGQPYFVMEYVAGLPITEYCDEKKLTIRERVELFIQVCEGVQHAHQKAVIHRDLKPVNILVVEVDGKPMPRIIDFGLAKAVTPLATGATLITQPGNFLGTPGYMSPEQANPGEMDIDTRTDVYSLGVVLYVLLTGLEPFDVRAWKKMPPDEVLRRLREEDPPRPSTRVSTEKEASSLAAVARGTEPKQLASQLKGDLDWITMKAVEKDRTRRYGAPSELAADLRRYLNNQPVLARPTSAAYRSQKFVRRHRVAVSAAVLGLTAILGATGIAIYQARVSQRRFQDVRKLAHTFVFDLHDEVAKLEGSTQAREMMVHTGLTYLDDLARSAGGDLDLQREIAAGYMKIGDAQGHPTKPNLGRLADALAAYEKSGDIYEKIAAKNPAYLPDLATFYVNYAGLVRFTDDRKRARALSESAIETFDRIRARQRLDGDLEIAYIHAWCTLGDLDEDMARNTQAWKEFTTCGELARLRLARTKDRQALAMLALADERIGTAAGELGLFGQAFQALDEDESLLGELLAAEPQNPAFHRRQALVHNYRSEIYYNDSKPDLNDAARALDSGRRYLASAEAMVRSDPSNRSAQLSRAIAMFTVSLPLREFDALAALRMAQDSVRIFDGMVASQKPSYLVISRRVHALVRLGEAQLMTGRLAEAHATAEAALTAERPIATRTKEEWDDEKSILVRALILAGKANAAVGDYDRAENLLREAREIAQKIAQSGELEYAIPLANADHALGEFYIRSHRIQQARICYEEMVELWQRFPETNQYVSRQTSDSKRLLASVH